MKIRQKLQTVHIGGIVPNTWNYNEQSEEMLEKTKENLKAFGQMRPIVVREYEEGYEIINGFHRWLSCKELGFDKVLVNNLGKVSDKEAKLLTILLNELKGNPNAIKLAKLIDSLYLSESWQELSNLIPFTDDEIENFRKIAAEAEQSLASDVSKEMESDEIVYQMVVTDEHAVTIDKALSHFDESVTIGDRLYEIALKFQGMENSEGN